MISSPIFLAPYPRSWSLRGAFVPQLVPCDLRVLEKSRVRSCSVGQLNLFASEMTRQSRHRSRTPIPPPSNVTDDPPGAQIGGGRRQPSEPPVETPTRLRSRIKPTGRDTGVVQQAERRRARMFEQDSPPPVAAPAPQAPPIVTPAPPPVVTQAPPIITPPPPPVAVPASPIVADVPPPVIAHAGPSLFVPAPPVGYAPVAPVVLKSPPTAQYVPPAPLASDIDGNIDPVLLTESLAVSQHSDTTGPDAEAPPSTQPRLPITRIIPPTPFTEDDSTPLEDDPEGSEPSTPTSGRRTAWVNKILSEGYEQLEHTLTNIVAQTSLTAQQVLDGWYKTHGRIMYGTNRWNSYARYLSKHEEQERRRLGLPSDTPITPTLRRQLYLKFKEDNHKTWEELLEVHDMMEVVDSSPQTVAQRAQTFNKIHKKVVSMLDMMAAKYGFEAALVMCGKTVNEDASLGFAHTTNGAKQFFDTRCRADEHTIIGHLKAHVYNQVSLEVVSDSFDNSDDHAKEYQPPPSQGTHAMELPPSRVVPSSSRDTLTVPQAFSVPRADSVDNASDKSERPALNDDMLSYIKTSITSLIKSAGGDVSKFKPGNFPWTTLAVILAEQGLVMRGWPVSALMPGESRANTARTKGITVLKKAEQRALCSSFENEEITITRVEGKDKRRALVSSASPVIIGTAPPSDSGLANAQQMYADATIDFEGPARLPPSNVATRIKRRPAHHLRASATADDPIIISSDDSRAAKETAPTGKKTDRTKASKKKARYVPVEDSSDDEARVAMDAIQPTGTRSATLASEDDYQDPGPSRKRKANQLETTRPLKKPTPAPGSTSNIALTKGKQPESRAHKAVEFVDLDSSDSDDEFPDMLTVRALKGSSRVAEPDPFLAPPATQNYTTPTTSMVFGAPLPFITPVERPSSPSPKRREPLTALTESHSPQESLTGSPLTGTRASVSPVAPPPSPASPSTDTHASVPPVAPPPSPASPPAGTRASFPPVAPPPSNPSSTRPGYVGETHGEWLEQPRQQIGGGYPYRTQGPHFPYPGEGMMIPLSQHRYHDARGFYPDEVYHGDPRGIYGGFHPHEPSLGGASMFPDTRRSIPRYANPYHDPRYLGPAPPPRASRSPSFSELHHPQRPSAEPGM